MAGAALVVCFVGDEHRLVEGQQLTFGRAFDLVLDDANLYLDRVVGRFLWWDGYWWVARYCEAGAPQGR